MSNGQSDLRNTTPTDRKVGKKFLALSLSYSAVFSLTATVKENALFPRHMFLCVCVSVALMLPIPYCFH